MGGFTGVIPGDQRMGADFGKIARVGHHQHRAAAIENDVHGQLFRDEGLDAFVMLAEHHQVDVARIVDDVAQHFRVASAVDVVPFGVGQAGRGFFERRLACVSGVCVFLAGPGGNHAYLLCLGALAEYAHQARLVFFRKGHRQFDAGGSAFACVQVHHQVLEGHNYLLP